MTPVDQTRFGKQGNCLAACFASILNVPLQLVDFSCANATQESCCHSLALEKLRPLGWSYIDWRLHRDPVGLLQVSLPENMLLVVGGKSPREPELLHAMVYRMRQRVLTPEHDPHPSRAGILDLQFAGVLIPVFAIRR
jgi:hypothetical protein